MTASDLNQYLDEHFEEIKENLRNEFDLTDISYNTWIKPLKFSSYQKPVVNILVPDDQKQAISYIARKYKAYFLVTVVQTLESEFQTDFGDTDIAFIMEKDRAKENIIEEKKVYNINSENANLISKYRFDTFIVGNNNKFAHSAALAVAESPGDTYNPLYLYSNSGLGKTHLMHSIGHFILDQNPNIKVLYVPSEIFTNEVIESIRSNSTSKISAMRNKYRSVDVLMIDDIQFIIGKVGTQEEFFNTFNELHSAGKQIIISSDKPPKDLETLEERFRTRFEWGLIADIQAPDYETRMAILKKNAENYGKEIDNAVFDYIASNITSNIRELEGAYNKLVAFSKLNKVDISMDIAEEALKDIINPNESKEITPKVIINFVADYFNISEDDITSRSRTSDLVLPRHICMYLCKELTDNSLQDIAKALNKKDHTTVMHGIERIKEDIKVDNNLLNTINILKKKISPA